MTYSIVNQQSCCSGIHCSVPPSPLSPACVMSVAPKQPAAASRQSLGSRALSTSGPSEMSKQSENPEVAKAVRSYLDRKGYRQSENLLRDDSHVQSLAAAAFELSNEQDSSVANYYTFSDKF